MPLNDAIEGSTRYGQRITWTVGRVAANLTGAAITGTITPQDTPDQNPVTRPIAGELDLTSPAEGEFTWTYHEDDVADPGYHWVQFTATYNDGTKLVSRLQAWRVYKRY